MSEDRTFDLSPDERARLLRRLRSRAAAARRRQRDDAATPAVPAPPPASAKPPSPSRPARPPMPAPPRPAPRRDDALALIDPDFHRDGEADLPGLGDRPRRQHDGIAGAEIVIDGKRYLNFAADDYLGLNGDRRIADAAKAAIDRYGTAASRRDAGEPRLQRQLERALAALHGTGDALACVGEAEAFAGVAGHLFGAKDLILHDALIPSRLVEGGARRASFAHNDAAAAAAILTERRAGHRHAGILIEGHSRLAGDVADLPAFIAVARRHRAHLLVDDSHAVGVLGPHGRGLAEHFGIDPDEVDLWLGSLGNALASSGGYVAARRELILHLHRTAPVFADRSGLAPPLAAAALAAIEVLRAEPERVIRVNAHARRLRDALRAKGMDTGASGGFAIVPLIIGGAPAAARLGDALFRRFVQAEPIIPPAVPARTARLRFVLSAAHPTEAIDRATAAILDAGATAMSRKRDLGALLHRLGATTKPTV
ncbi:MAG: aminotransferase class I/II-fold pyridoxal phosphate-dependent enzyme [Stellaceae bacterium]